VLVRGRHYLAVAFVVAIWGCKSSPADPDPDPNPTPDPLATPVGAYSCTLGKGVPTATCQRATSAFFDDIQAAIEAVIAKRPELFDLTDEVGAGSRQFKILDKEGFLQAMLDTLRASGFCAELDYRTLEHLQVKNTIDLSEEFDVYSADGHLRRGALSYILSCSPARFPLDPGTEDPPPGTGCGKPYPPPVTPWWRTAGTALASASPTGAASARCVPRDIPNAKRARPGVPDTRSIPGGLGPRGIAMANCAPARTAAARTILKTSTHCTSFRTAPASTDLALRRTSAARSTSSVRPQGR
jgi:hypothetical protein